MAVVIFFTVLFLLMAFSPLFANAHDTRDPRFSVGKLLNRSPTPRH